VCNRSITITENNRDDDNVGWDETVDIICAGGALVTVEPSEHFSAKYFAMLPDTIDKTDFADGNLCPAYVPRPKPKRRQLLGGVSDLNVQVGECVHPPGSGPGILCKREIAITITNPAAMHKGWSQSANFECAVKDGTYLGTTVRTGTSTSNRKIITRSLPRDFVGDICPKTYKWQPSSGYTEDNVLLEDHIEFEIEVGECETEE
jgi:hypothetical protein